MSDLDLEEDLTSSQKLVLKVLEISDDPLTQQEIADESWLPKETVRHCLYKLEDEGLIDADVVYRDVRRKVYTPVKW